MADLAAWQRCPVQCVWLSPILTRELLTLLCENRRFDGAAGAGFDRRMSQVFVACGTNQNVSSLRRDFPVETQCEPSQQKTISTMP